jgi:hypothetical protein
MEENRHFQLLQNILWSSKLEEYSNDIVKQFIRDVDFSHSNVILHGKSNFITKMVARKHIVKDANYYSLKFISVEDKGISYKSFTFPEFIEIDCSYMENKFIIDILKSIIMTKSINMKKHTIIIHNLKLTSKHVHNGIRKLIEMYSTNVFFIITVDSLSYLDQSLKSRCTNLNCNFNQENISRDLVNRTLGFNMPSSDFDVLFKNSNFDCVNVCILLNLPDPMVYKDLLREFIYSSLDTLIKEKDILKYNEILRDLCYKLTGANIQIKYVSKYVFDYACDYLKNKNNNKIYNIVKYTSECDQKMLFSNKVVFLIEQYFDTVVEIIKN